MSGKSQSGGVYTRVLENFGGLDTAHPPSGVAPNRFTKLENLWRDYAGGREASSRRSPAIAVWRH